MMFERVPPVYSSPTTIFKFYCHSQVNPYEIRVHDSEISLETLTF
jgi:hypothetical protein